MKTGDLPRLVYCDDKDNLYDHPFYLMAVFDGHSIRLPRPDEVAPLPPGSDVFVLKGRRPIAINPETNGPEIVDASAAAAFASPAYLRLTLPAYERCENTLPLFAYAPIGWLRGRFVTSVVRVDRSRRQDPRRFDREEIGKRAKALVRKMPRNRLVAHLEHCAMVYGCRAAQNFFLGREECPLPTSPLCNASCAGCLSEKPAAGVPAPHERISFVPTPDEIAEVACLHIARVRRPVVSFGQGCEGEPLMVADVLFDAIREIRRRTGAGTINLNTNGSRPASVARLCEAGLDSIRLSVNSFRESVYESYFKPRGYGLNDVITSGKVVHESGGFVSVNLLVFPGVSDTPEEISATIAGLQACCADYVQMRNLNIDPFIYLNIAGKPSGRPSGLLYLMERLRQAIPHIRFGYFNPPVRSLVIKRRRGGN